MPDPSAQEAAKAAHHAAMDPATIGAWGAFAAAVALAFRRIFPAANKPKAPSLAEQLAEMRADFTERLSALASKDDLRDIRDTLGARLEHMEQASEQRVSKLHERLDAHLEQHGRAA